MRPRPRRSRPRGRCLGFGTVAGRGSQRPRPARPQAAGGLGGPPVRPCRAAWGMISGAMAALLEPLALGSRTARNRVVFGPHETNLARRRAISDRHVAYYRRRAEGGAGVIVVEEASVHESDWPYERCPLA